MVNIKKLRQAKGLTQAELAELIGVVTQSICGYESRKIEPSVQVAMALGRELGFDWWLYYENKNNGSEDSKWQQ